MGNIVKLLLAQAVIHTGIILITATGAMTLFTNEYHFTSFVAVLAGIRFMHFADEKITDYFNE